LRTSTIPLSKGEQKVFVILIIVFHVVGLIGFAIPGVNTLFVDMVPFHLLLMLVFVAGSHRPANGSFLLFVGIIFLAGFSLEWIGVNSGWIFGKYAYGPALGIQVADIPLCIGVNWFLLIYSTGVFMKISRVRNMMTRVLTGAFILVLLDFFIEPIAVQLNYWHWANNTIPFRNYIGWFFVSAILLFVFEKFQFKKQSIVAPVFLATQFVFFIILRLIFLLL
jgi:bisanhydrobacterioruberin hydratase